MSEKKPEFKVPEGLPDKLSEISDDLSGYMAGIREDRERSVEPGQQGVLFTESASGSEASGHDDVLASRNVDPEIKRATFRLLEGGSGSVYEDLGAGNPQKRKFDNLRKGLFDNIETIEINGAVYANGDRDIFKLVEGLKAVKGIFDFPGWDIRKNVAYAVGEFQKTGGEKFKRNRSVIIYDSLNMLQAAFRHTVKNPATHERSEELIEQFTEDICPSGLWGQTRLRGAMLESIDQAYEMVAHMTNDDPKSIEGFIRKMQLELLRQGLDIEYTRGQSQQAKQGNERKLANTKVIAWEEWIEAHSDSDAMS